MVALGAMLLCAPAALAQDTETPPTAVEAQPTPSVITVPNDAEPPADADDGDPAPETLPPPFVAPPDAGPLPKSGLGGVIVEPGMVAVDISNAVSRYTPTDEAGTPEFATYLVDFVNRLPTPQTRILVLDTGVYGGQGAAENLAGADLVAALTSDKNAPADIVAEGARTRIRIEVPGSQSITAAFKYSGTLNQLTVEMWDERALSRFETAATVLQGILLGLLIALGAWLCGLAILRRDRMIGWLASVFLAAFLTLLTGFGFSETFSLAGIVTSAGLALSLFALTASLALAFVLHALAPEGRWRGFGWVADYAPWLVAACGLLALFNAPYAAGFAKIAAAAGLTLAVLVVFARAWEGDAPARRLTFAAIFILLAFAPLSMLELVEASGRVPMLAASSLLTASLLMAAFAVSASAPPALRQRVGRMVAQTLPRDPEPAFTPAPLPPPNARDVALDDDSRFSLALAAAHQGLWDWDLRNDLLFLSPSVEVLLGAGPGALRDPGRDWRRHIHQEDLATFLGALEDYRRLGDVSFVLDFRAHGQDGIDRWVQLRASFMSDGDRAARCIGLVSDVSAQKESEALLLASARQDPVSGLANRAFLLEALSHRLAFAAPERRYALLAFDLARFRTINEGLGHAAGDALLATVADRVRASAPDNALPARLNGDVFVLLWPADNPDDAGETAKFVLDTVHVPVEIAGRRIVPAVRGGLLMLDGSVRDAAGALGDAELALAEARRGPTGTLAFFAPDLRSAKAGRAVLERDLAHALERGEIVVHYQPIVRVTDRRPVGFEALLRWRHPERGLLTAEAFAQLAEESGYIESLGRFALETALADLLVWRRSLPPDTPLFVNVNVSARQLASADFAALCRRLASEHVIEPGMIHLEITETMAFDDSGAVRDVLLKLKQLGFGLVMDDFGVGHSTPGRLAHQPFDAVKIDRSFLAGGVGARNVLAGLLRLARDLELDATAEGVESEEDLAFLNANACLYAQGYFCGMPRDATITQTWLTNQFAPAEAED